MFLMLLIVTLNYIKQAGKDSTLVIPVLERLRDYGWKLKTSLRYTRSSSPSDLAVLSLGI